MTSQIQTQRNRDEMDAPENLVPHFEVVNLSSRIKKKYFDKQDLEQDTYHYSFHISCLENAGIYFITSIVQNLELKGAIPVIVLEIFPPEEKNKMINYIRTGMDFAETRDWSYLWFSDGKQMSKQQFYELRTLWLDSLKPTNN
jgi:hypothetical protein